MRQAMSWRKSISSWRPALSIPLHRGPYSSERLRGSSQALQDSVGKKTHAPQLPPLCTLAILCPPLAVWAGSETAENHELRLGIERTQAECERARRMQMWLRGATGA